MEKLKAIKTFKSGKTLYKKGDILETTSERAELFLKLNLVVRVEIIKKAPVQVPVQVPEVKKVYETKIEQPMFTQEIVAEKIQEPEKAIFKTKKTKSYRKQKAY